MAVESRRDVSSPGDSSPMKLEGPCFHVHNPRKRAGFVSPPQLSDDDGSCSSSSEVQVVEVPAVPSKRQRQRQSRSWGTADAPARLAFEHCSGFIVETINERHRSCCVARRAACSTGANADERACLRQVEGERDLQRMTSGNRPLWPRPLRAPRPAKTTSTSSSPTRSQNRLWMPIVKSTRSR